MEGVADFRMALLVIQTKLVALITACLVTSRVRPGSSWSEHVFVHFGAVRP
jgi:hypothetical protein